MTNRPKFEKNNFVEKHRRQRRKASRSYPGYTVCVIPSFFALLSADMVVTYKVLLFNVSLLFLCLSSAMEGANAAALGAFSLKYYNVEFGVSGAMSSLLASTC